MGAWSHSSFGNDDAMDFIGDFMDQPEWSRVLAAIALANAEGYLESPDACNAIVSAELLAARLGKPGPDLPEDLPPVLAALPEPGQNDVAEALRAIARIMDNSELAELWSEGGPADVEWLGAMEDLLKRLSQAQ